MKLAKALRKRHIVVKRVRGDKGKVEYKILNVETYKSYDRLGMLRRKRQVITNTREGVYKNGQVQLRKQRTIEQEVKPGRRKSND